MKNKKSTGTKFIVTLTILLLERSALSIVYPSNTQVSSFSDMTFGSLNRPVPTIDGSLFACRYRSQPIQNILVIYKSTKQMVWVPIGDISVNKIHNHIALSDKNIVIASFTNSLLSKYIFAPSTSGSSTLLSSQKMSPLVGSFSTFSEIELHIPFIFGTSDVHYCLLDTSKNVDQMITKNTLSFATNIFERYIANFPEKPTTKLIAFSSRKYLVRFSYLDSGANALVLDEYLNVGFWIYRMNRVPGTDFVFLENRHEPGYFHLVNAIGTLDANSLVSKVLLPPYMDSNSFDLVEVSPAVGFQNEPLIQVWTFGGRILQFNFPDTGKEPQFYREVWHKRWKTRFALDNPGRLSVIVSRYLPETGDFVSCKGCGKTGRGPCSFSWQCSPTCSSCYGPGQAECTSCPPGSSLENGACVQTCSQNQYRKSKTECVDCPSDYTYIKSNLTCLNCWDHNDYSQCGFTRLGYNISLVQESFLNISFTYTVTFYGEKRSLEKLNDTSINWPRIFRVENLKEKSKDPECEKPRYSYDYGKNQLKIDLGECEREAQFSLRTLRTKLIQDRYKVPLMVNLSSDHPLNEKIFIADDEIPTYYRFLRFILWALFLIFFLYLLLSDIEFINNQTMKMIGNFLKMVDFIQCLALLEVEYRVLTKKFFWLVELIFSSPDFEIFEVYLNDKEVLRRERYLGKVYEEYGDKMAFNNYDLVISFYFASIFMDVLIGVLPWKLKRLRNIAEGFREFLYSYAFFEFFINILMDLSNIKKIMERGNWLTWLFIIFEGIVVLTESARFIKKIIELNKEKDEENQKKEGSDSSRRSSMSVERTENKFGQDSERDSLVDKKNKKKKKKLEKMFERRLKNSQTVGGAPTGSAKPQPNLRSLSVNPLNQQREKMKGKVQRAKSNHLQEFENSAEENIKNKKTPQKSLLLVLLLNFELVSDMRFAVVQIVIVGLRKPKKCNSR